MFKVKRYVVEYERELSKILRGEESQLKILKIHNAVATGIITDLQAINALNDLYRQSPQFIQ